MEEGGRRAEGGREEEGGARREEGGRRSEERGGKDKRVVVGETQDRRERGRERGMVGGEGW